MEIRRHKIFVNGTYLDELRVRFDKLHFDRVRKVDGLYITNPDNLCTENDKHIFKETEVKQIMRSSVSVLVPQGVKNKLSYFSQEEDKEESSRIYQFDDVQSLQPGEIYAIQYIGHATVLIQIPGLNILTDPVFYDLNKFLYSARTESFPSIEKLPRIDVIVISHNHRDHVDRESLEKLIRFHKKRTWPLPKVFVPVGNKSLLESFGFCEVEEVEWYTKISVETDTQKNVNFISVPADHRSGRSGFDHHKALVTGWVIAPEQGSVIFKFAGDTRCLTKENQLATDAVLWNEMAGKKTEHKEIPYLVFFEPSGPNYTRSYMDVTHQSTSYSALLKFIEAENLAVLSGHCPQEFLQKINTLMVHHNKFELGPDRFNEGLFVFKKLCIYLNLNESLLSKEYERQIKKLEEGTDREKLKLSTSFTSRPLISTLPKQSSLLVHSKDFIIRDMREVLKNLKGISRDEMEFSLVQKTHFPRIGERLNHEQVLHSKCNVHDVEKYKNSRWIQRG